MADKRSFGYTIQAHLEGNLQQIVTDSRRPHRIQLFAILLAPIKFAKVILRPYHLI